MINISNERQDKALSELVRSIGSPIFPEVLGYFVSKFIEFDNLIVLVYYKDYRPEELYRESNDPVVYETMQSHYIKAAYLLDPFYHMVRNGIQTGIYSLFELAPDKFKSSNYFTEYYSGTNLIDEFSLFSCLGHDMTLTACFGRDKKYGSPFKKVELDRIKKIKHVLSALCTQHWRDFQPKEKTNITLPPLQERLRGVVLNQCDIRLSPRQAEVALYILQGHSSLSISLHLNISIETVKVFRKQLYTKCNISSQAELFSLLMPLLAII